jgi:uncharacterized protein YejL (UPF0352 family)
MKRRATAAPRQAAAKKVKPQGSIANTAEVPSSTPAFYKSMFDVLQKQVNAMSVELKSQQETIVDLSTHVTFITNWLEKSVTPEQCTAAFNDFAAAVKRPAITASDRTAHESIVAAVYVDHQRRTDRATNFIVTGLPPSDIRPDPQAVVDLCRRELGEAPDIVHTKRLGKLMPGRVQPLLVVLRTAAQAVRLVTAGKKTA